MKTAYWEAVMRQRELLPETLFLTSIESVSYQRKGGVVSETQRDRAARLIVEGSHRPATEEEITAYKQDLERRTREIEMNRPRDLSTKALMDVFAAATATQQQQKPKSKE